MKPTWRKILFCGVTALMAAALFQGARLLSRQREEIAQLQQHTVELETKLGAERRTAENETRDLLAAEKQLAEMPQPPGSSSRETNSGEAEIADWLAHVRRLKQLFEERPEQTIPEMRLLTDEDWLRASRNLDLTDDDKTRRALARVRGAAVSRFAPSLRAALAKYMKSDIKIAPADIMELAPLLANPDDADLLSRYQIAPYTLVPQNVAPWIIQEKSAVDADYDTRNFFYPSGATGQFSPPLAWIPNYLERADHAYKAYVAANHNVTPADPKALIPYFDPPLDSATAEKIMKSSNGF